MRAITGVMVWVRLFCDDRGGVGVLLRQVVSMRSRRLRDGTWRQRRVDHGDRRAREEVDSTKCTRSRGVRLWDGVGSGVRLAANGRV